MVAARDDLAAASLSTPRIIALVRLHYCCAMPIVAMAAPSLSQLMQNWEFGTGPEVVPSLEGGGLRLGSLRGRAAGPGVHVRGNGQVR